MSAIYTPVTGQSMYDVVMITYGSPDFLVKLANDNGITDLNNINLSGKPFIYDNSLTVNQVLQQQLNKNYGTANATSIDGTGDGFYHDDFHDDYHD